MARDASARPLVPRLQRLRQKAARRLSLRGAVQIGLFLLVVGVATAVSLILVESRAAHDRLQSHAALTANILAPALVQPVWHFDTPTTDQLIGALANDPDVAYATLTDQRTGLVLSEYNAIGGPKADIVEERVVPYPEDPDGSQAETMAKLEIGFAATRVSREVRHRTIMVIIVGALIAGAACLIVVWILEGVTKPVRQVTGVMSQLAAGVTEGIAVPPFSQRNDEVGEMVRALEVLRDHAAERARLYHTIEETVRERTAELTAALDHLRRTKDELVRSEKLAALGGMVAAVAHEVNTPLGSALIVGTSLADRFRQTEESLAEGKVTKSVIRQLIADGLSAVDILTRNLQRAAHLVRSFKEVAVDRTSERRRRFVLDRTIEELVDALRPKYKLHPVTLSVQCPKTLEVDSYPGPFGQVLTNLIENAFVHAFNSDQSGNLGVAVTDLGERIALTVQDDGRGIPSEHLTKLFDPFFTTKLGQGGSGLGLYISYRLVTETLGGTISADSVPGKGTVFQLTLPKIAPDHPKQAETA